MKTSIILSTLLAASFAFAQGTAATAPAAAPAKKMTYKEAKAECKKDKTLKGAELQKCIKEKKSM